MKVRSLFIKIFLWFWLAMLLVTLTMGIAMYITRPDFKYMRRMDRFRPRFHGFGVIDIYENKGLEEAKKFVDNFPFGRREHTQVFDDKGKCIFGQATEVEVAQAVTQSLETGRVVRGRSAKGRFAAHLFISEKGRKYVIVDHRQGRRGVPPPIKFLIHGDWKSLVVRIFFLAAITFILCFGLARYLTNPIIRLQKAARAIAEGKLNHRIEADIKGRQDELVDLAHDFDKMADRVQELLNTQRRLLGDISHELRTPLTRMNVALELAREGASEETSGHLDRIERESQRLQELIGRIVTLVRLETGGDHFTSGSIDLASLVNAIVSDTQIEAKSRNCVIESDVEDECVVFGSRELLRRAVENVIRNALRHTPEETVVEVSCKKEDGKVVVEVRDHGDGVAEEQLEKLFEPFYRCEEARERSRGGVGLGLAIVKRAMAFHDGQVEATNCDKGGLRVILKFPIESRLVV